MSGSRSRYNNQAQQELGGNCVVTIFSPDPDRLKFEEQIKNRIEKYAVEGYVFRDIKEMSAGILMIFQK